MAGPFTQYVEPGTYTRTLTDSTLVSLTGAIRIPLLIGVGSETLSITDYEIVRGSSSQVDNPIYNEDVSIQFTGTSREFYTSKTPIVTGEGQGVITTDPKHVQVTINGLPVGVSQVFGSTGKVVLAMIPRTTDVVKISYFFKRTDTFIPDENLSVQADGSNTSFKVIHVPIVDGSNGGIATTNVNKITVKVAGIPVVPVSLDGQSGTFTLAVAPGATDEVLVSYWTNDWQDTFDYLPVSNIVNVVRVGTAPGRSDFTNTLDFVIEDNKIQWGNSFAIKPDVLAPLSTAFDKTQINAYLYDNKVYMRPTAGTVNGTNKEFTLEYLPVEGTGRGTVTNDVSKVSVYVGTTVQAAELAGPVEVTSMVGSQRKIFLKVAPLPGEFVFATYWHNMLGDDTYTFTSTLPSITPNPGTYTITSANNGNVFWAYEDIPSHFVQDPDFAIEGITFPTSGPDVQAIPGYAIAENILLAFQNAYDFNVMSSMGPEGSNGTGTLGQTYIDAKTGLRFTVMQGATVTYQLGDLLEFNVDPVFETNVLPQYSIPGLEITVSSTNNVAVGNTALLSTYNKSGLEPKVGDFYFVSLDYSKTEYPIQVYTKIKDVAYAIGPINIDNRLSLAAHLAFSNGAIALALAQVIRDGSGVDASAQAYLDILKEMESPIKGTNIKPDIICPITTKQDVINAVRQHCETMSTIRFKTERTGVFGFPVGTKPEEAQQFARNMKSERMIGLFPDGAIVGLVDELGNVNEAVVDGSFLAAAYTGLAVNPVYDVATPLTHKTITGFRRLIRSVDSVTMNQTAIAGITILEDLTPNLLIRQAMTTNPSNVLTREPSVIYIKDYVQQQIRAALDKFIGIKLLPSVIQDVEATVNNLMNVLVNLEIITAFTGTTAEQDENDPTILKVESFYSPVFPLNWIVVTLNLRVKL